MIPQNLRKQINKDERFKICFMTGVNSDVSYLPIQIHHALYGSSKIEELWNYVPLRVDYHETGNHAVHKAGYIKFGQDILKTRDICELFALSRASNDDLIKYNLIRRKEALIANLSLAGYVKSRAFLTGWGDDLNWTKISTEQINNPCKM